MPSNAPGVELVGTWERVEAPACAARYPLHLRLEGNGLYRGRPAPPAQAAWWDLGLWRVTGPGRVAISTANDAVLTYAYSLKGDRLTFTDSEGCRFSYHRTGWGCRRAGHPRSVSLE